MALTQIEAVRLKTSDKSVITRSVAKGNGIDKHFKLDHAPVVTLPALEVRKNDLLLVEGVDFTVNYPQGIVTMVVIPSAGTPPTVEADVLEFTYYWSVFSDDEVDYFISEAGGDVTIASARLLLAWAADAAKLAKRQTLSGGGGLGQVVIDTSVAAKELRLMAAALIQTEQDLGESIPADGLTEVIWTEAGYIDQFGQSIIRRS